MADYDFFGGQEGTLEAGFPTEPQRRRRLLTLQEMSGNPFLPALRQSDQFEAPRFAPPQADTPHQPRFAAPDLDIPPLAPQQATSEAVRGTPQPPPRPRPQPTPDTSLTSIPTQGPQAAPTQGSGGGGGGQYQAPQPTKGGMTSDQRWQKVFDAQREQMDMMKPPDMTQAVDAYRQRYEGARPDIALGMLLSSQGGRSGREFGGQVLRNALAQRQPQVTDYGTLDYASGFTGDPMKERQFKIAVSEKNVAMLEKIANNADTREEQERAHRAAEAIKEMQERHHQENRKIQLGTLGEAAALRRQQFEQGKWQKLKGPDGEEYLYNTTTRETVVPGAPGAGAPGAGGIPPGLKLTDTQARAFDAADKIIGALPNITALKASPGPAVIAALTNSNPALRAGLNAALSADERAYVNAAGKVLAGILRKESGAAITAEEWRTYGPQYLPWFRDDERTIADKVAAIEHTRDSYIMQSGPAGGRYLRQRSVPGQAAPGAPAPAQSNAAPQGSLKDRTSAYKRQVGGS